MTPTQRKIERLIRAAATKDCDTETWRKRLEEWTDLVRKTELR